MAELADLLREVADGASPAVDSDLLVVTPPDARSVGVLAFPGLNVVSVVAPESWVRHRLPRGDLSAPVSPPFLNLLAAATGYRLDSLDVVLAARASNRPLGMELTQLPDPAAAEEENPRLRRALRQRTEVRAWRCAGGLLVLGRGVGGRWEASVEVDAVWRGFGLGRGLFAAALGLVPFGEPVWAQVAPGNAASMRAALAAGYRPVGAEVLLFPPDYSDGDTTFSWFTPGQPGEQQDEPEIEVEPTEPLMTPADQAG